MKNLLFAITVILSLFSCQHEEDVQFTRKIDMQGEHNFRDLGFYQTTNSMMLKPGMIYRSGSLHKLTEEDVKRFEEMGIKTVVNFLLPEEIQNHGEDNLPPSVRSVYLPIDGNSKEVTNLIHARKTGDFSAIPTEFNADIHKLLPETGKEAYVKLFGLLEDPANYPLLFHCSHGVHRTGTAAAILLSSLGVPWETVQDDYMLSHSYRLEESQSRVHFLDSIAIINPDIEDKEQNRSYIESFYYLQPEYIQSTKDHIESNYGSFEDYLRQSGVSDETLKQIQEILLVRISDLKKINSDCYESSEQLFETVYPVHRNTDDPLFDRR